MPSHRYLHLDVFTDRRFSGNQLAVFPQADELTAALMQEIAAEINYSETTFVLSSEWDDTDCRMRIFTPGAELPMAGHPTIGSAFALAREGVISPGAERFIFGLGVGPTPVRLEWAGDRLTFAWMRQPRPEFLGTIEEVDRVAASLGVTVEDIADTGLPPQVVSSGVPMLFVAFSTRRAVDVAALDRARAQHLFERAGIEELPVFVFSLERGEDDATAYSRMFAPTFGIAEDPATGGASGPLGAYLVAHGAVPESDAGGIVSRQGVAMGRPSRIHISIRGTGEEQVVEVGGESVLVGEGTIDL